ncbi:MAG: chaperonin GroEL [Simkaniaceae bacterium]|nr:chaperonin GroEL [Simkaniaceae bacterium]
MTDSKELIFEETARTKLSAGIEKLTNAIKTTLGPNGRNIGLESSFGSPKITSDSGSIVADIELKDQYENMGASFCKEVAEKMKSSCGDGTTTAILLLSELTREGMKNITAGTSPIELKREMDQAVSLLLEELNALAVPVKNSEEILHIATVSASGDPLIGKMIADAMQQVGPQGVITIEAGKGTETSIKLVEGMEVDRGNLSPYFCTNLEKMSVELTSALILVTDKKISTIHEILPLVQHAATTGTPLFIIAEDIEGDALATLVINKLRGSLKISAIKAPAFGDQRKAYLEDIAILTGATLISADKGMTLKEASPEVFGRADRIEVTKDRTKIIGGQGLKEAIKNRILLIEGEIDKATSPYEIDKLKERKAKLAGGVAVIKVGAPTETEMQTKKQIFQDSLNSTYAAYDGGYVPGGGIALLKTSHHLNTKGVGGAIVRKACEAPFKQIVTNSGCNPSLFIEEVMKLGPSYGFNALSLQIEDLLKSNIIDPMKVIKNSLSFAASIAGVFFLSEVLIGDAPHDEN